MDLIELYKERFADLSDKGNVHTYVQDYYSEEFFMPQRIKNVLEIGVQGGGSVMMWHEWFPVANVIGLDVDPNAMDQYIENKGDLEYERLTVRIEDAYTQESLDTFKDNFFDYIIDDGPHSFESQEYAVKYYLRKVRPGGKLIIEDIANKSYFEPLLAAADPDLVANHKNIILNVAQRSDDMIFEITRR